MYVLVYLLVNLIILNVFITLLVFVGFLSKHHFSWRIHCSSVNGVILNKNLFYHNSVTLSKDETSLKGSMIQTNFVPCREKYKS